MLTSPFSLHTPQDFFRTLIASILYLITSIVVLVEGGNHSKIIAGVRATEAAPGQRQRGLGVTGLVLPLLLAESTRPVGGHACSQSLQERLAQALVLFPRSSFAVKGHALFNTGTFVDSTKRRPLCQHVRLPSARTLSHMYSVHGATDVGPPCGYRVLRGSRRIEGGVDSSLVTCPWGSLAS